MSNVHFKKIRGTTLYNGDCIKVMESSIEDGSIDLIFADPPYNIGKQFGSFKDKWVSDEEYFEWCKIWIDLCIKKLKPNGSFYLMCSTQALPYFDIYLRSKLTIMSRIVWSYDSSGVQAKKYFGSLWEPILFCVKDPKNYTFNSDEILVEAKSGAVRKLIDYRGTTPKPYNTKKVPGNVWEISRVRFRMPEYVEHPSQKPEALLERIIKASSNVGDLVLDPFSGTFSTVAVADKLGRRSIGIEQEFDYFTAGVDRISNINTGTTSKAFNLRSSRNSKNTIQEVLI